jgi:hypothetical protein
MPAQDGYFVLEQVTDQAAWIEYRSDATDIEAAASQKIK